MSQSTQTAQQLNQRNQRNQHKFMKGTIRAEPEIYCFQDVIALFALLAHFIISRNGEEVQDILELGENYLAYSVRSCARSQRMFD